MPAPRNTLQLVLSALFEREPGSGDEVLDRSGHPHLAPAGERLYPRGDVDGDPGHVVPSGLDLAHVDPRADLDAELAHRVDDPERGADRLRRALEHGEEPVAGTLHGPAELRPDRADRAVVVFHEQIAPGPVSLAGGPLRRPDDVGEQDRSEERGGRRARAIDAEERTDRLDHRGLVPGERGALGAGEELEPRPVDLRGHLAVELVVGPPSAKT